MITKHFKKRLSERSNRGIAKALLDIKLGTIYIGLPGAFFDYYVVGVLGSYIIKNNTLITFISGNHKNRIQATKIKKYLVPATEYQKQKVYDIVDNIKKINGKFI